MAYRKNKKTHRKSQKVAGSFEMQMGYVSIFLMNFALLRHKTKS
jgi:hypothetical protein